MHARRPTGRFLRSAFYINATSTFEESPEKRGFSLRRNVNRGSGTAAWAALSRVQTAAGMLPPPGRR